MENALQRTKPMFTFLYYLIKNILNFKPRISQKKGR